MASHRLAVILRSTGLLSEQEIDNMSEDKAWHWLRFSAPLLFQAEDESGDGVES